MASAMGRAIGAAVLQAAPRARPAQRAKRRLDIGDISGDPLGRERQGWNGFERRKWAKVEGSDPMMKGRGAARNTGKTGPLTARR